MHFRIMNRISDNSPNSCLTGPQLGELTALPRHSKWFKGAPFLRRGEVRKVDNCVRRWKQGIVFIGNLVCSVHSVTQKTDHKLTNLTTVCVTVLLEVIRFQWHMNVTSIFVVLAHVIRLLLTLVHKGLKLGRKFYPPSVHSTSLPGFAHGGQQTEPKHAEVNKLCYMFGSESANYQSNRRYLLEVTVKWN